MMIVLWLALGLIVSYGLLIWLFQDRLIYVPTTTFPEVAAGAQAVGAQRFSFRCADADQIAWLLPPAPQADRVLVIACIGNAGCAAMWLEDPAYLLPQLHGRLGAAILAVDYPGYGACPGRPSPEAILLQTRAAQAAALTHLGWDRSTVQFAVIGMSLGTGVASQHAVAEGINRLALISPYTSLLDMARLRQPWPFWHLLRHRFDNRASIATIAGRGACRVQIWHGDDDQIIPVAHSRQLAAAFAGVVAYREVAGAGHDDVIAVDLPCSLEELVQVCVGPLITGLDHANKR